MECKAIDFVSSQHFYGICISKAAELPSLSDGEEKWLSVLDKINALAKLSAQRQIASNEEKPYRPGN